ncbi:MAG: hypothetical protein JWM98_1864 [Thermoleophilia bacterium]|nr:hypothetical protein [Thermoleophilia bacterium]
MTPTTTTSTGITIRTNSDGQRAIAVRTATTVRTGPDFRERLAAACAPPAASAPTSAPATDTAGSRSTSDLLAQLRDLLQQLMDRLDELGHRATARPGLGHASCVSRHAAPTRAPAATAPTQSAPSAIDCHAAPRSAPPSRVFEVHDAADPTAVTGHRLRVSGGIALEPVTEGAKLDEGIRRIDGFLHQVSEHVRNGGTFTDEQLGKIADEATALYREAIRPTTGASDVGDYSSPGRDGVLDLGSSTSSIAIQASLSSLSSAIATPAPTAAPTPAPVAIAA